MSARPVATAVLGEPGGTSEGGPLLEVRGVRVEIGGRALVDGVDVAVDRGEVVGLVGPNGAGKTTLLRAVSGVLTPASGAVLLGGRPIAELGRREFARQVAVVQQLPEAPSAMTVGELVLLGRHPHLGWFEQESSRDRQIALLAMGRAGCSELAEREIATLSGGERRRAFIARALAQEPALLLLDEPTANLDAGAQAEIGSLLRALAADGVAVLVVLHDLTLAASVCDRVVLMSAGRVVASGAAREVITAEHVARVYGAGVGVIRDPASGRVVVVPVV
jgi:iron complex transport system ATP-binding protein